MPTQTIRPAAAPVRRSRPQWPVPAGLILLSLIPVIFGALAADRTDLRRRSHAAKRAVLRVPGPGGDAHRQRHRLFPARGVPVRSFTSGAARLAPHRRAHPHPRRPARCPLRAVDVRLLPAPRRLHRRPAPALLRHGDAGEPGHGARSGQAAGLRAARRLDDARLCHCRRRRNAGLGGHPLAASRRPHRRAHPCSAPGGGLGDQRGSGRVRHPPAGQEGTAGRMPRRTVSRPSPAVPR